MNPEPAEYQAEVQPTRTNGAWQTSLLIARAVVMPFQKTSRFLGYWYLQSEKTCVSNDVKKREELRQFSMPIM